MHHIINGMADLILGLCAFTVFFVLDLYGLSVLASLGH